jgi:hypothetical protein
MWDTIFEADVLDGGQFEVNPQRQITPLNPTILKNE